jgi:hypothetical protein
MRAGVIRLVIGLRIGLIFAVAYDAFRDGGYAVM